MEKELGLLCAGSVSRGVVGKRRRVYLYPTPARRANRCTSARRPSAPTVTWAFACREKLLASPLSPCLVTLDAIRDMRSMFLRLLKAHPLRRPHFNLLPLPNARAPPQLPYLTVSALAPHALLEPYGSIAPHAEDDSTSSSRNVRWAKSPPSCVCVLSRVLRAHAPPPARTLGLHVRQL